jgi:hypothetical protein
MNDDPFGIIPFRIGIGTLPRSERYEARHDGDPILQGVMESPILKGAEFVVVPPLRLLRIEKNEMIFLKFLFAPEGMINQL